MNKFQVLNNYKNNCFILIAIKLAIYSCLNGRNKEELVRRFK